VTKPPHPVIKSLGMKMAMGDFENNKPTGLHTFWFDNGTKRAEINYRDGIRDGEFTFWHSNGQIKFQGSYLSGQVVGTWTVWHSNGHKYKETDTIKGTRLYWYDNGQMKSRQFRLWYLDNAPKNIYLPERNWDKEGSLIDGEVVTIKKQLNYINKDNVERFAYECTGGFAFTYFDKEGLKIHDSNSEWIMDGDGDFDENEERYHGFDYSVTSYNFFDKKGNKNRLLECSERTSVSMIPDWYAWKFFNKKNDQIYEYHIDPNTYKDIDLYDELMKTDNKELNKILVQIKQYKSVFEWDTLPLSTPEKNYTH